MSSARQTSRTNSAIWIGCATRNATKLGAEVSRDEARNVIQAASSGGNGFVAERFVQIEVPRAALGKMEGFLQAGINLPVEFCQDKPISVTLPDVVEVLSCCECCGGPVSATVA